MTNQPIRNPWLATRNRTGAEYDAPYAARAAAGFDIHGEANFITRLLAEQFPTAQTPQRILDAGCGTGRMGIELARRGYLVTGVDLDEVMLSQARHKAPELAWYQADLATIKLETKFECIAMAGNVMIFLTPGSEAAVLANMAAHLTADGLLVAAFELTPPSWSSLTLTRYDQLAADAGLTLAKRWAGWDGEVWTGRSNYAVSVHSRKPADRTK